MHPLDNVIWEALTTRQTQFAEGRADARRIIPEVGALAGLREPNVEAYRSLRELVSPGGTARVWLSLLDRFESAPGLELVTTFPGLQMVYENGDAIGSTGQAAALSIEELGPRDSPEMVELATLTRPGPFERRTHELGKYIGIRLEGKLIAMAGERLKVPGYTEVSAVCTHPDFRGRGYAQALVAAVADGIYAQGETPILHVLGSNVGAIRVYRSVGFVLRRTLHLAVAFPPTLGD